MAAYVESTRIALLLTTVTHLVQTLAQAGHSQLARTPQRPQVRWKKILTDAHSEWMVVRALRAWIGLNGLSLLGSHPWPCPWTQRLHLSSVLAWAMVQVCLFPVLPSGRNLDPHCRQLVSWVDAPVVYYSLSPAMSLAFWTLTSCCSLVSSSDSFPVSFHPWPCSFNGPLSGVVGGPCYHLLSLTPWPDPVGLCPCRTAVAGSVSLITEPLMTMRTAIFNSRKGQATAAFC